MRVNDLINRFNNLETDNTPANTGSPSTSSRVPTPTPQEERPATPPTLSGRVSPASSEEDSPFTVVHDGVEISGFTEVEVDGEIFDGADMPEEALEELVKENLEELGLSGTEHERIYEILLFNFIAFETSVPTLFRDQAYYASFIF